MVTKTSKISSKIESGTTFTLSFYTAILINSKKIDYDETVITKRSFGFVRIRINETWISEDLWTLYGIDAQDTCTIHVVHVLEKHKSGIF